jgi:hypothetical protein
VNCKVTIGFPADTSLPRDVIQINPHYGQVDNPQALADALKTHLIAIGTISATIPFTIKVYDAEKAPPSFPLATATQNGTVPVPSTPREVALCLSYYSTYNRPRFRGRLYIPYMFITGSLGSRPTPTQRDFVLNSWGGALFRNLPPAMNGIVWSKRDAKAYGITNLWVDDEWDTVRSRGGKPTTRSLATIP